MLSRRLLTLRPQLSCLFKNTYKHLPSNYSISRSFSFFARTDPLASRFISIRRNTNAVSNCRSIIQRQFSASPRQSARYIRFEANPGSGRNSQTFWGPVLVVAGAGGVVYYVMHLEQMPDTGRWRFMDVSPSREIELADDAYLRLLSENQGNILPSRHPLTQHVRRIVSNILNASDLGVLKSDEPVSFARATKRSVWSDDRSKEQRSSSRGLVPESGGKEWHLLVVDNPKIANAAAAFGNIVVYTGILPFCKNEDGLAAVLSHEIGHVVARHSEEMYSKSKVFITLAYFLQYIGINFGIVQLVNTLLFQLPNSRTAELEADTFGMKLMSKACYDPRAAVDMHSRLAAYEKSQRHGLQDIAVLRTHPTSTGRIQHLEELLPGAYATRAEHCSAMQDMLHPFRQMATWA